MAGKENGEKPKPRRRLVRIQDGLQDITFVHRIYREDTLDSAEEPVYCIVVEALTKAGGIHETRYTWTGDEAERYRDEEWSELEGRLEDVGYEIL